MSPHPPTRLSLARHIVLAALLLGTQIGCARASTDVETLPEALPLQPLIYTELPDLTARAAAVRERRLMRELVEGGADESASWGRQRVFEEGGVTLDATSLGQAIADALLTRDERRWDQIFVSPSSYASMVHVSPAQAHKFVDEIQGASTETWSLFHIERPSEAPEGGLSALLELRELTLGQGRTLDGKLAEKLKKPAVQYWGNTLKLGLKGSPIIFELRIPKILIVIDRDRHPGPEPLLVVASPIEPSKPLKMFVAAGMHLKPELMRSQEYPYPLTVGSFWRYRRLTGEQRAALAPESDPLDAVELLAAGAGDRDSGADELLREVLTVERYGSVRLVKQRVSFNDQALTSREIHWLVTPLSIYPCDRTCVRQVERLDWLLDYLQRVTPLYQFPLRPGRAWGAAGERVNRPDAPARVRPTLEDVEVPAGRFVGAFVLDLHGSLSLDEPLFEVDRARSTFVQGQGVVRQELEVRLPGGERQRVIAELVEVRIMP